MRGELKLNIYTLENCAAAVLRLRVPHIPPPQLSSWFAAGPSGGRWRCLSHLALRARLSLALLDRLDLVGRTSELARTFGIDFFAVLSRGSQYRVESMTLRLAHSQNYVTMAPSPEQVARQPAMEALPLVMEPRSALYPDPVCVLDFQSLYPSMIIAYNLCYSTCVGKPAHAAAAAAAAATTTAAADGFTSSPSAFKVKLGCSEYVTPLEALSGGKPGAEGLVVAPNGVAFVPSAVRPGILPRLLSEILSTRIMVKAAMKRAPSSLRVLLRCLNARQFGLKLIANVTYGYTAAGFSGRMPMAELADAIVQSGRATLENAIAMVESHPTWKAKVVYGDTDSLFVQLPGRTVEEAFAIGAEMAASITAANPPPVTLKLEKVYRPCVLLSKKRYVGAMYESPSQKVPNFDAKGIETVRRDSCPAVAKIMEKVLRLLFASGDLSTVRMYLEKQWTRILSGRVSISDFIFAKEVRLGTYSTRAGVVPPAALVATRAMASDPRAEPRYGERVPYVVVYGEPGARLADMVVPPRALVESGGRLRLHAVYYITKQIIPAIERALSLVGADVKAWFAAMPRPQRTLPQKRPQESLPLLPDSGGGGNGGAINKAVGATSGHFSGGGGGGALTIDRFYLSRHCAVCDELTHASKPLCERCLTEPQLAAAVLSSRCNRLGRQYSHLVKVCGACGGGGGVVNLEEGGIVCDSLDCGVYFERRKVLRELQAAEALATAGLKTLVL
jgi:DNA polymerase zeta